MSLLEPVLESSLSRPAADRALALCDAGLSVSVFAAFEEWPGSQPQSLRATTALSRQQPHRVHTPMSTAAAEFLRRRSSDNRSARSLASHTSQDSPACQYAAV